MATYLRVCIRNHQTFKTKQHVHKMSEESRHSMRRMQLFLQLGDQYAINILIKSLGLPCRIKLWTAILLNPI